MQNGVLIPPVLAQVRNQLRIVHPGTASALRRSQLAVSGCVRESARSNEPSSGRITYCVPDLAPHPCRDLSPALAPDPAVAPARLPCLAAFVPGLATSARAAHAVPPLA